MCSCPKPIFFFVCVFEKKTHFVVLAGLEFIEIHLSWLPECLVLRHVPPYTGPFACVLS